MFYQVYENLVNEILNNGTFIENARTKTSTRAVFGTSIRTAPIYKEGLPLIRLRKTYPHIAGAELAWTLSGVEDIASMQKYTSIWDKFAVNGKISPAYGHRWRHAFGRDQLQELIDVLLVDPTTRQALVITWDPGKDGLMGPKKPNVPCPFGFSVYINGNNLVDMVVYVRSSDVVLGLPYDTLFYALLLKAIVCTLNVRRNVEPVEYYQPNIVHMFLANAHIYEPHIKGVVKCLQTLSVPIVDYQDIPAMFDLNSVVSATDLYVELLRGLTPQYPSYNFEVFV